MKDILHRMRMEVQYSDKVTMPIPLYEEIKGLLGTLESMHQTNVALLKKLREYEEVR